MPSKTARRLALAAGLIVAASSAEAPAQQRVDGAIQQHGFLGETIQPDEISVTHGSEFKGAHRVAISVFDVAFPNENHFTAVSRGHTPFGGITSSASASMKTTLTGVDRATRQRIADTAYAAFVAQLQAAGYEVVDQAELGRLAPEFNAWGEVPNFSEGRFGTYVAPTGQHLRFLQGDTAKRDTSGAFGQQMSAFRVLDRPQAFDRSPYIAYNGKIGVIAVTLVVDYGVYSSSGENHAFGHGATAAFKPGVTIAAGNIGDHGTLLEYWGPKSGGFPAVAFLQQPIRSDADFAVDRADDRSPVDASLVADPVRFEAAANDVAARAIHKLVSVMLKAD